VDTPDAFGSEVTMIAGMRSGQPVVFVLMTGDHPAQVAGFADPAEIGFGDLVAAMLDAGRRAPGVNGSGGDADLLERWTIAFAEDIDEPSSPADASQRIAQLLSNRDLVVWERDGEAVSMAAVVRRTPWSSSVAYVYTPPPLRRRGYASAVVAGLSQRELDAGQSWCSLFTDAANPTSNHIYTDIGYQPRCDFRHLTLTW
jgi:GNAT superfamily N-acetyltransferase